ncbi:hypothetical protein [Scandinavium goeteborgense]|uniref:Uncharacterized protein n=1 Tax=Scandinavium goeteborgense TaxID=1851514 RepID=A0A4R6E1A8_SCAGO|nr:hypothetical protein [Scandinavium goeteborgense]TDN51497.1 hypothetical protein EC847_11826 [Scandinavium goeteborgense]
MKIIKAIAVRSIHSCRVNVSLNAHVINHVRERLRVRYFPIAGIRSLSDLTAREVEAGAATLVKNATLRVAYKPFEGTAGPGEKK